MHGLAVASQNEINGIVTISDHLNMSAYNNFAKLLKTQKVTTVIFKNCFSGNGLAAFRYAEKIKERKIATVASGVVASGCAFAYLGGSVRLLDKTTPVNTLVFHGGFNPATLAANGKKENQVLLDIFEKHIGFTFASVVKDIILNTKKRDEGIYFLNINAGKDINQLTFYCDGNGMVNFDKCMRLDGINLETEGITTK